MDYGYVVIIIKNGRFDRVLDETVFPEEWLARAALMREKKVDPLPQTSFI